MEEREEIFKQRRRALVSALRSETRQQARGSLKKLIHMEDDSVYGYCCLGVACEVAMENGLELSTEQPPSGHVLFKDPGEGSVASGSLLTLGTAAWYGFDNPDPRLSVPQQVIDQLHAGHVLRDESRLGWMHAATALNDSVDLRLTLAQIGDCFEYTFLREDWLVAHGAAES